MTAASPLKPALDRGHTEPLLVFYDDLDAMGFVHNARYALFVERALHTYWTRKGFAYVNGSYTQPDACLAVAEYAVSYRMPVRGTGPIHVQFWIDKYGESSATYGFRVHSPDGKTVHAEGRRVHIRLDDKTMRPAAWSPQCRAIYDTLLGESPVAAVQ
jgi:acyl-CoA thioester hydrolase